MRMNDTNRPPFFPMMINLSGQKVLIVGGGNVASRRAFTLKKCGAEIVAVSPKFSRDFPPVAKRIEREFDPEDLAPEPQNFSHGRRYESPCECLRLQR